MSFAPVLEVGGSHVTAAVVTLQTWAVDRLVRAPLDPHSDADRLLTTMAAVATGIEAPPSAVWGVAMPDPFDYATGVARFRGVGKFDALDGVDVGAALRARIGDTAVFRFGNDADAFALGEYLAGAGAGCARLLALTLGTGVGSGWLVDGAIVTDGPGVPPGGNVRELQLDGRTLEDHFSSRALRAQYAAITGRDFDVAALCAAARSGDAVAAGVVTTAAVALGRMLGSSIAAFGADGVVVGGSIAGSWDVLEPGYLAGLDAVRARVPPVRIARLGERAALIGAAAQVV